MSFPSDLHSFKKFVMLLIYFLIPFNGPLPQKDSLDASFQENRANVLALRKDPFEETVVLVLVSAV